MCLASRRVSLREYSKGLPSTWRSEHEPLVSGRLIVEVVVAIEVLARDNTRSSDPNVRGGTFRGISVRETVIKAQEFSTYKNQFQAKVPKRARACCIVTLALWDLCAKADVYCPSTSNSLSITLENIGYLARLSNSCGFIVGCLKPCLNEISDFRISKVRGKTRFAGFFRQFCVFTYKLSYLNTTFFLSNTTSSLLRTLQIIILTLKTLDSLLLHLTTGHDSLGYNTRSFCFIWLQYDEKRTRIRTVAQYRWTQISREARIRCLTRNTWTRWYLSIKRGTRSVHCVFASRSFFLPSTTYFNY